MQRDRADRGLTDATQQAAEAVRGLVDDGPVKLVRSEIAALERLAEQSEASAVRWQQASDGLDELHPRQRFEREQAADANDAAKQQLELVRAGVAEPMIEQARAVLTDWQDADTAEQTGPRTGYGRQGGSRSAAPPPSTTRPRPSPATRNDASRRHGANRPAGTKPGKRGSSASPGPRSTLILAWSRLSSSAPPPHRPSTP
ncbi:hypothetical protein BJF82_12300 [Kytococcus sp. CUA-901]|nr:hypothetical protein BJF82_12300 [Kytococcus sp. CUA-901]